MKKTVTANISGFVFNIDEDAYERLNEYLGHIRDHLSSDDGTDEILSDIESRIAEMFQEKITASKTVITISDVKEVISQLGEPEQFEDPDAGSEKHSKSKEYETRSNRRLYRDPDDKYIAGVAGGLAAFFNLDPVWIRAAFIVFTFVYGFGPLLYIILWIVVPRARTTAERLEMRGEKVNISNIEKSIREELNDLKENIKEFSKEAKETFSDKGKKKKKKEMTDERRSALVRALGIAAGVILLIFGFSMLIATASSVFLLPFTIQLTTGVMNFAVLDILSVFIASSAMAKATSIALFLIIGIPILWIIMTAIQLLFDLRPRLKFLGVFTFILWLAAVGMLSVAGVKALSNFSNHYSYSQQFTLTTTQSPNLYFELGSDTRHNIRPHKDKENFSNFRAFMYDSGDQVVGFPNLMIKPTNGQEPHFKIIRESRGATYNQAMANATNLNYTIVQQDSLLTFDPFFFYNEQKKWRGQKVRVELYVPRDKVIMMPRELERAFPVQWDSRVQVVKTN